MACRPGCGVGRVEANPSRRTAMTLLAPQRSAAICNRVTRKITRGLMQGNTYHKFQLRSHRSGTPSPVLVTNLVSPRPVRVTIRKYSATKPLKWKGRCDGREPARQFD